MLNALSSDTTIHEQLDAKTELLTQGLEAKALKHGVPFTTSMVGGMFGLFFTDQEKVTSFAESTACDAAKFAAFFQGMLKEGVYLAPSAYEAGFMSAAISEADIDFTLEAADKVFATLV
jgi:glutamate-1-semialdehyde 2,1-aminomutase